MPAVPEAWVSKPRGFDMSKRGKRYQKATESLEPQTFYSLDDALLKIKETASAKFDETVAVSYTHLTLPTKRIV